MMANPMWPRTLLTATNNNIPQPTFVVVERLDMVKGDIGNSLFD
jgi:hypothetical protein